MSDRTTVMPRPAVVWESSCARPKCGAQRTFDLEHQAIKWATAHDEAHVCPDCKGGETVHGRTCLPCLGTGELEKVSVHETDLRAGLAVGA